MTDWELDSVGVRIPKQVARYGTLARARYKAKRHLRLTPEEVAALHKAQEEKHQRWARKIREKRAVRSKREAKLRYWRSIGYPTSRPMQERMMALLSIEFDEGISDRKEQAARLGIRYEVLANFLANHRKYYLARVEEYLSELRKKLEEKLAVERIGSMQRTLKLNVEADEVLAKTLRDPDASHASKLKVVQMVKEYLGMTREDMREDDKMTMAKERHTAELDTIKLLTARGRFQKALPDIPVEAEVMEEEEEASE
jgi:hypothetical protein